MASFVAEFEYDGIRVQGFSAAGEETWVAAPEMNLAFDIGRAPSEVIGIDHIFLSHGHMDHAAGVAYYFSQRMFIDNAAGNLYAPAPLIEPIRRLLAAWADIDGHEPPANVTAAVPGRDIVLRRDLVVRPFEVNHPCRRHDRTIVRSLGFAAIEVRQKLKDEFVGLEGPQLVALKGKGVEITRRVEMPLVTYCGDTAVGDFLDLPFVRDSRVLLLECTFLEPDHKDRARAGYHLHVSDLRSVIPRLKNERILLTHISRRTALGDARAAVRTALSDLGSDVLDRISFLMEHRRRRGRSGPPRPGENATIE